MARKKLSYTISLTIGEQESLIALSERMGYLWGDRPWVSGMLADIASGKLMVKRYEDTDQTIEELRERVATLEAKIEVAKSVLN